MGRWLGAISLLILLCGCSQQGADGLEDRLPQKDLSTSNTMVDSSEWTSSQPSLALTASGFNLTGTVIELYEKDDSYGTPYWFFTVETEDGSSYDLLSDRMQYQLLLEQGKEYQFSVVWGAARGDMVTEAIEVG